MRLPRVEVACTTNPVFELRRCVSPGCSNWVWRGSRSTCCGECARREVETFAAGLKGAVARSLA